MTTKEDRLYHAWVACATTTGTPAAFLKRARDEHQDGRVITVPLESGPLVQLYACQFSTYRVLLTKCAEEDDNAWTIVYWEPAA